MTIFAHILIEYTSILYQKIVKKYIAPISCATYTFYIKHRNNSSVLFDIFLKYRYFFNNLWLNVRKPLKNHQKANAVCNF